MLLKENTNMTNIITGLREESSRIEADREREIERINKRGGGKTRA